MFESKLPDILLTVEQVKNELEFLSAIDARGEFFYDENVIRKAWRRYERCWIPLVKQLEHHGEALFR